MHQHYAYTPYIWPSVLTVALLVALVIYSGRRRSVPGALPFAISCLLGAVWITGSILEIAGIDAETKIFWYKAQLIWQLPVVTAVTCFVLEYVWPGRWLSRRNLTLLSVPPLLNAASILSNNLHHLDHQSITYAGYIVAELGPLGLAMATYAYALGIANLVALVWLALRSTHHRWPVALIAVGQIIGRTVFLVHVLGTQPSRLPLDVIAVAVVYTMYAVVLFGYRIFDPVSLAYRTVVEQMRSGVLVLDGAERIVSMNPASERILGTPLRVAKGRPVRDLLHAWPAGSAAGTGETEAELSLGPGPRYYMLATSLLRDWREMEVGRLLVLRDVTDQKQVQAQVVEQQRTLAMLEERERLARELHDSVGQVLGYVSLQAQAVTERLRQGDTATAEAQLARLAGVAQDAHADVRDSIRSLRSGAAAGWSFLAALEQHLAAYQEAHGIGITLARPTDLTEEDFGPGVGAQLVRVIQEALTNARKHARASTVRVTLAREGTHAVLTVTDDGDGFDPDGSSADGQEHYGLAYMRERMAQIGGSLTLRSAPGAGTEVRLQVPLRNRPPFSSEGRA